MAVPEITIDNSNDVRLIMRLMGHNEQKKFALIQQYVRNQLGLDVGFQDLDTLEQDLFTLSRDTLEELYELIDQRFSIGYPYFVYEFRLRSGISQQQLKESIDAALPLNERKRIDPKKLIDMQRVSDIELSQDDFLRFHVTYERFEEKPRGGDVVQESTVKTTFEIIFDFQESLLYFTCGDATYAVTSKKMLTHQLLSTFDELHIFSLGTMVKQTTFEGEFHLDRQSVVILHYLETGVQHSGYTITDYLGITFQNIKSERVKGVRLSGNELFESVEVAERVRLGDRIRSVKSTIFRITEQSPQTAGAGITTTVRIDFNGGLKVVFSDMENGAFQLDYIRHLVTSMKVCLGLTYRESEVRERIRHLIERAEAKDNLVCQRILGEIRHKISLLIQDDKAYEPFLEILDPYITD